MKSVTSNALPAPGFFAVLFSAVLLFAGGCATPPSDPAVPPPVSEGLSSTASPGQMGQTSLLPLTSGGPLSLPVASAYSMQYHPEMAIFPLQSRIADARILTAGVPLNPAIAFEMEDFGGSRDFEGLDSAVYTAWLVQVVELGGKPGKRREVATAAARVAEAEYAIRRREVLGQTAQAFMDALAAQAGEELAREELTLALESAASVKGQLEAGRATEPELRQAQLAVSAAELEVRRSGRTAVASVRQLAALWGGSAPKEIVLSGRLPDPPSSLPSFEKASAALESHPINDLATAREEEATAMLALARAGRIPDVEVSGGFRQATASDSQGLVAALSVPLPLFDQQSGPIRESEALLEKAQLEARANRAQMKSEFDQAWSELANAHDTAVTTGGKLLPGAREIFQSTRESYDLGRASFLELLAARRELAAANRAWLSAKRDYNLAAARIEALTGKPAF